ncbi:MAG: hypothetical protein IT323_17950 [Anaerolineae bacterium]|nr:hypothetical protein [Anaerolineae bacterium]
MLYRGVDDTGAARQTLMRALAMLNTTGNDPDARQAVLDALRTLNQPAGPTLSDDPDQRIEQLEQYIRDSQPHEVHWYIDLAALYRDRGEAANARRTLMRALAMLNTTGNDPDARQAVLDALRTLDAPSAPPLSDDPDQRIEQLEQYIRDSQPHEVHWYIDLAALYRERGEAANARRTLMRALAMLTTTGDDPDARQAVLDALNRLNEPAAPPEQPDLRQLIEDMEARITETSSTNVDDYLELADLYVKAERQPFARRTLLRALHVLWGIEADAETHQRVRDALHRIEPPPFERRSDDPLATRSDLARYVEYWLPTSALPYLELATLVQAAGDPGQARWVLLRALEMQTLIGGSADAQRHVLDMLRQIEVRGGPNASPDLPSRIRDLEAFILATNPNDADLYLELAALYRVQGDDDASRRALMRALEMLDVTGNHEPRVRVTEALRSLDVPLEPSGPRVDDPQAQIDALRRLIDEQKPQDVKPYLELAALYRDQGDTASARRTLMRALAMLTASGGSQDERNAVLGALNELRQ